MNKNYNSRIFAVSLSTNGIGYAVMEGNELVEARNKVFLADKNANSLIQIEKLITRFKPDVLVLPNVTAPGTHRSQRIKQLHRKASVLANRHKLKVATISNQELRTMLTDDPKATKHQTAEHIAQRFPDQLGLLVPPKRKAWTSELKRMDLFEAVGLAVVFQTKEIEQIA